MKKLTKFEIARKIESIRDNAPWSLESMITLYANAYTRQKLVDMHNYIIDSRKLNIDKIC